MPTTICSEVCPLCGRSLQQLRKAVGSNVYQCWSCFKLFYPPLEAYAKETKPE